MATLFPWVSSTERALLVGCALVTEFLDGFTARRFGWVTELGRILDPVADKLLFLSIVATSWWEHRIAWYEVLAIGVRDILVALGIIGITLSHGFSELRKMEPRMLGKWTTALQYIAFFILALGLRLNVMLVGLLFLIGASAAIQYIASYLRAPPSTSTSHAESHERLAG